MVALAWDANDFVGPIVQAEVSITGATTLTSSAFGRQHTVTGSSDYTITLPSAGTAGQAIGFSFRQNAANLIRLTGVSMGGLANRYYITGETLILRSNGSTYDAIEGLRYPWCEVTRTTDQSLTDETWTTAEYGTETSDTYSIYNNSTYVATANRPGRWQLAHYLIVRATTINAAFAGIRVNSTTGVPALSEAGVIGTAGGAQSSRIPFVYERTSVKGDTFQPAAWLDGVTDLKIDGTDGYAKFGIRWIGHE